LLFYFIIIFSIPALKILISNSCENNEMSDIQDRMEAYCFKGFNQIPFHLEKGYWFNTATIYETC